MTDTGLFIWTTKKIIIEKNSKESNYRKKVCHQIRHYVPWEVLIEIFSFSPPNEYYNLIVVCRYFATHIISHFMKDWFEYSGYELKCPNLKHEDRKVLKYMLSCTNECDSIFLKKFGLEKNKGYTINIVDPVGNSEQAWYLFKSYLTVSKFRILNEDIDDCWLKSRSGLTKNFFEIVLELIDFFCNGTINTKTLKRFKKLRKNIQNLYLDMKIKPSEAKELEKFNKFVIVFKN